MSFDLLTFGRLRGFSAMDGSLLLLSIASSVIYFVTKNQQPYPGSVWIKALSIAPLAVLAVLLLRERQLHSRGFWLSNRDNLILGAALAFSCLGDVFLDLTSGNYFIHGLASFLIAHLIYILLFMRNWQRPLRPGSGQLLLAALVLVYALGLSNWLSPGLGEMKKPVMVYICAITVMVVAAILTDFDKPWVWLGVILFLISDSIIAINRFKQPVPMRDYLVWATYYLGQYGIAVGFMQEKLGARWIR